jgi:hypothetical protein
MYTVALRNDLRSILEKEAEAQKRTIAEIVDEAVQAYFLQRDRAKIAAEQAAYEQLHSELKRTHFGQWVAVHDGQVVDTGTDNVALHRRVLARYGDTAILITQVEDSPRREIQVRSPRVQRPR